MIHALTMILYPFKSLAGDCGWKSTAHVVPLRDSTCSQSECIQAEGASAVRRQVLSEGSSIWGSIRWKVQPNAKGTTLRCRMGGPMFQKKVHHLNHVETNKWWYKTHFPTNSSHAQPSRVKGYWKLITPSHQCSPGRWRLERVCRATWPRSSQSTLAWRSWASLLLLLWSWSELVRWVGFSVRRLLVLDGGYRNRCLTAYLYICHFKIGWWYMYVLQFWYSNFILQFCVPCRLSNVDALMFWLRSGNSKATCFFGFAIITDRWCDIGYILKPAVQNVAVTLLSATFRLNPLFNQIGFPSSLWTLNRTHMQMHCLSLWSVFSKIKTRKCMDSSPL